METLNLWFVGEQFPPSTKRKKRTDLTSSAKFDSEADIESEAEQPPEKKSRRKYLRKSNIQPATKPSNIQPETIENAFIDEREEGDVDTDNLVDDSDNQQVEHTESDWEVSDFLSSDESCDEWVP